MKNEMAEKREAAHVGALQGCLENYVLLLAASAVEQEAPAEGVMAAEELQAFLFQIGESEKQIAQEEETAREDGQPYAIDQMTRAYGLSGFERFVLQCLYLDAERKVNPAVANIAPSAGRNGISLEYIADMYRLAHPVTAGEVMQAASPAGILRVCFMERVQTGHAAGDGETFRIRRHVYNSLKGFHGFSKELARSVEVTEPSQKLEPVCIREDYLVKLLRFYEVQPICVNLYGQNGIGKKFLACHMGKAVEKPVFALDVSKLMLYGLPDFLELLIEFFFTAKMRDAILCLKYPDIKTGPEDGQPDEKSRIKIQAIWESLRDQRFSIIFSHEKIEFPLGAVSRRVCLELPGLTVKEKHKIWQEATKDLRLESDIYLLEYANKYIFTPGEINQVAQTAALYGAVREKATEIIQKADLLGAIKQETRNVFGGYAVRIQAAFTFDDLVVSEMAGKQLQMVCNQIRYRDIVGEEWGFYRKFPYGRGISVLFYGSPGTGKTMAAQVLSYELGLDLYRIDSSQLISKYIGETEKNISELFRKAQSLNAILFFDEADALFARRSEVADSNDRNANAETAHLLQKFEEYDGIVILATNYLNNLDHAFKRRIRFMVGFEVPSIDMRRRLWEKNLPQEAKTEDHINFEYFAKQYELTGSDIKEILLNAAFLAASEHTGIKNRHIEEMVWLNHQKKGKLLSREECLFLK